MMKRMARFVAALCLFAFHPSSPAQESATLQEFVVVDLRPQAEKDGTGLSPLDGKCNKGVFRIADVATDPLKIDVLKDDLAQQLRKAGAGKTLIVLDWSIYYNESAEHGGGGLTGVGIQGYSVPAKQEGAQRGSKCSHQESAGGWYLGSEATSKHSPLVSEFSGTFGGKPVNVRVVHSPHRKITGKFVGAADDTQELLAAVHQTGEALAAALEK